MAILPSIETCANDLNIATRSFIDFSQRDVASNPSNKAATETSPEAHRARNKVFTSIIQLQALLAEPSDFIQHLASQVCKFYAELYIWS